MKSMLTVNIISVAILDGKLSVGMFELDCDSIICFQSGIFYQYNAIKFFLTRSIIFNSSILL